MPPVPPFALTVQLRRGDFLYDTWVLALKRPVLLFLIYTFLLSVTGIYSPARVYLLALMLPLVGYLIWVYLSARLLWSRFPALRAPRHYIFKASSFCSGLTGLRVRCLFPTAKLRGCCSRGGPSTCCAGTARRRTASGRAKTACSAASVSSFAITLAFR